MLTLYHNNQEHVLDTTEYYVRELASGLDEIIFDVSIWDPNYAMLQEEANIVDRGGQRYLVKQIDAGAVMAKIVCQLDLDEWRASLAVGYDSDTKTVAQQIDAVKPAGWTVVDLSGSSIGRTIHGDYTPLQVCEACRDLYKVYIRWDNKAKICTIYPQAMGSPVGSFATRELNLKEINYKGKSNNFATRLYAVGKDGLTFASINSGKPYVDNNTYSSRVICAYWQDDRYTDKQSLLDDAVEKLAKLAVPERSYDCAIVDLQATNPLEYNNLDFSLFTVATLIDDSRNTAINYQVVERHVWPYHPDRNDVIFNSEPVKIQNSVIQIEDELTDPNSDFYQILLQRQSMVTDWLTNADSHVYIVPDDGLTGIKEFLFVNGDQPIETATQVMRLNSAGLGFSKTGVNGPFTNAFVFDSTKGGHLVADFITAGTLTANLIKAGVLTDEAGKFSLNMETGALSMADGSFSGSISGSTITGSTITSTDQGGTKSTTISGGTITTNDLQASSGNFSGTLDSEGTDQGVIIQDGDLTLYTKMSGTKYNSGVIFGDIEADPYHPGYYITSCQMKADPTATVGMRISNATAELKHDTGGNVGVNIGGVFITGNLTINSQQAASGSFTSADGKSVTVVNGIITKII